MHVSRREPGGQVACFLRQDRSQVSQLAIVGGNKYRLVAAIAYSVHALWVKAVLTHAEYDKEEWK